MISFTRNLVLVFGLLAVWNLTSLVGASKNTIPDLSGKILTVKGPIDPSQLGPTIMHEHVLLDYRGRPERRKSATDASFYDQPVSLANLSRIRTWTSDNGENLLLGDVDLAVREVLDFKRWGGSGIVDCTSIGLGRDPSGLLQVSNATGLHLIMGTGFYLQGFHPPYVAEKSVDELAEIIIQNITVGVSGTPIRSGVIGEVGIGNGSKPREVKSARAAARASRATGAAISLHSGGHKEEKLTTLDLLVSEGADPNRVIVGHSNHIAREMSLMKRLIKRGAYIQFDLFGEVIPRLGRIHDYETARAVAKLVKAGHANRVLLSQDVCTKSMLKTYGGMGFSYVMEFVLPELRRLGVGEDAIWLIMVENPRRVLTFAKPG